LISYIIHIFIFFYVRKDILNKIVIFTALAMQLDKHMVGYLTYRAGIQDAMSTMIVRDTSQSYTAFSIHFGLLHSFVSLNYTYKMEEKQLKLRGSVKLVLSTFLYPIISKFNNYV